MFEAVADSFTGLVRQRNEDAYIYAWDECGQYLLTAVADGIGSTRNGDVASLCTLQLLTRAWRNHLFPKTVKQEAVREFLTSAFSRINRRLFEINSVTDKLYELDSLGTTLTAAIFMKDVMIAANAGDSPLFRIRDGRIKQLTFDHNLANEMFRCGRIAEKDKISLEYGRMLTRFIGPKDEVEAECCISNLKSGDRFLLCSDGLTLHVEPDEICKILTRERNISEALKILLGKTIHRGAMDNVTVVLVRVL